MPSLTSSFRARCERSKMEEVLHVLTMSLNPMSVGMIEERRAEVSFKGDNTIIKISDKAAASGER